ncbi:amino acid adenylation domain-containing protein [Actinosynnema sp. NPDC023587]|uniref:non-ribosomal peptide synthetase family protein n=1 Tax=Actinosynnema sp. NPDC023587 TaxID=3154695 RepID=UPI0033C5264B
MHAAYLSTEWHRKFNETTHEFPDQSCLPDLLHAYALERPDDTAVVHGAERLSFRQLVDLGTRLGGYLRHIGVVADDCVGVFVEPSIDLVAGTWGVLFSGGAYLPLSPEYPEDRLRYMIEDSRTRVVFTQERLAARLAALVPEGTEIVTLATAAAFTAATTPAPGPRPRDLAYVIYTSGSTGKPKGVMIEHRSVVNQLHWLTTTYGLDRDKVVLQKTPAGFDAAQWEILASGCGSRVVIGGPGIHRDPERLIETVIEHDVTTLQCVPTLLRALLDTEQLPRCTSLTQVFSGGEALSRGLALEYTAAMPRTALVNLYGPTECTINSSAFTVDPAALVEGLKSIPIGRPVHNTRYHVLDEQGRPVAIGEIGELHISGVQVARGYLHRPQLTGQRFAALPLNAHTGDGDGDDRAFKTGDLVSWNADGTVAFLGRVDNQVKLRGFRIELDEIKLAIEAHDWVKTAAVIVKDDPRTGFQNLIACVELNAKEAALMDQGTHGAHHQSKEGKQQVKAQLSNPGLRDDADLAGRPAIDLPGATATPEQRRQAFTRKTYRFYEGGDVDRSTLLALLAPKTHPATGPAADTVTPHDLNAVDLAELGEILRYFGAHHSPERLLPKYGYASPGSLYATQMYWELSGIGGLAAGFYYYHPVRHTLVLIKEEASTGTRALVHFIGRKAAVEPIYRNNIREVLEIETGHLVGLFEEVLPGHGLDLRERAHEPAVKGVLGCADEDYYLGTFELVPHRPGARRAESVDVYVQAHPGRVADLPAGLYRYRDGNLTKVADEVVLKRHVIAINQRVYERAAFGIALVSRSGEPWLRYVDLGRKLQHLSANGLGLGFMASGYSSETGHDLPSAKRLDAVLGGLGEHSRPSYFFVGGQVSERQRLSEGMNEDVVHMKGPAEMVRDDLVDFLPDYMIPNKVVVLDRLPVTANGKLDLQALRESDRTDVGQADRPFVAPRNDTERRIARLWGKAMRSDCVSTQDDFFANGGNSLIAVAMINGINRELGCALPLQVLFEAPTIEQLARRVDDGRSPAASRLVPLHTGGSGSSVYCWPGLGGYVMNLRLLASRAAGDRPFHGVQAYGVNEGETLYDSISEMAAADVAAIRLVQPTGPYTLWGYSFGARVAFEAAYQLEQAGEQVEHLFLLAPGSPEVRGDGAADGPSFRDTEFLTILFSVFAGTITGPLLRRCLETVRDEDGFAAFVRAEFPDLDHGLVLRIIRIVARTYRFEYTAEELARRRIIAPVTVFKARGDRDSFIEHGGGATRATVIALATDHYGALKESGVDELAASIRRRITALVAPETPTSSTSPAPQGPLTDY